jgi:pimeloyl-ACP methyl ester carboxylesterase
MPLEKGAGAGGLPPAVRNRGEDGMRVVTLGRIGRGVLMLALLSVIVSAAAAEVGGYRAPPPPDDARELVFLVHGMGRTPVSMYLLERRLEAAGYRVVNFGYSVAADSIGELGGELAHAVAEQAGSAPRIHFVGHSLGNILVRWMLVHAPPPAAGRVVMLAPPNQGAAAADRYGEWIGWLLRPVRELGTGEASVPRKLPTPGDVEIGVVAGARDGTVRVAETRLDGAREHVVVPAEHTFIMNRGDVHQLVLRFLREGSFHPAVPGAGS